MTVQTKLRIDLYGAGLIGFVVNVESEICSQMYVFEVCANDDHKVSCIWLTGYRMKK